MSTLSQFGGGSASKAVANFWSSGGVQTAGVNAAASTGSREVLSGALTANTLKTLVSITTGGAIPFLSAYAKNATTRTIRLVVICDGVTVFDATSAAVTAANAGLMAAGSPGLIGAPIRFSASCVIQVASSLSETDAVAIGYSLT